jgi:hypothetical protein
MIDHYPFASQVAARRHARAANLLWRNRPNQPPVTKGSMAPDPPPDVIAVPVQRPNGSWAVLVYKTHAPFITAINGRSVTVRGTTFTISFPSAQTPPVRLIRDSITGVDVVDRWGAALRDLDGVEP